MKKLLLIMLLMVALPASSQYTGFYKQAGKVVDAETGKPLQGAIVKNHRGSVQTDEEGRYTIDYHTYDSDLRLYVSHPNYYTDTFGYAPELIQLRPLPKDSIQRRVNDNRQKNIKASKRPTVAVVLSGGGAKGVAHISALKAIEEAGIPIDIICGTSMGSLIGALYCIGYTSDDLDSLVRSQDWTVLLSDRADPATLSLRQREEQNTYALIRGMSSDTPEKGGLIRGRNLNVLFRRLCAGYLDSISFDSLPIRFACVATDIVTNGEVVFHDGYLVQAMRASMAIPAVFTPVRIGEMVLIDGGLRNNYPADVARQMGADIIIGVTVQNDSLRADEITDAMSVFNQIIDINSKNKYDDNVALSDIFMKVDVHGYSAASFTHSAIDTLIRRGAEEAARHTDDLQALSHRIVGLGNGNSKDNDHSDRYRHRLRREPVFDIDSSNTVPPQMDGKSKKEQSKLNPIVSVGFRFDTVEMGALQLNGKLPFWQQFPMELAATIRLGKRIMAKVEYGLSTNRIFSPSINYTFRNNDFNIYSYGIRTYSFKYFQHQAEFTPINFHLRRWEIKAGVRWEYFDYYGGVLSIGGDSLNLTDNHYFSYRFDADLNTEDHWYFPSRGTRLHVGYAYITDNMVGMDGTIGLTDAALQWRANLPVLRRFSLQSSFFTRLLLGGDVPLIYRNAMGGEWFGHTMEQQVPFAGIGHQEFMERYLIGVQLQAQVRIMRSQYIMLRLAFARNSDDLGQLFWPVDNSVDGVPPAWHTPMFGAQIGYSYSTLFGPIDARLGYSTHTRAPYFFLNIGHRF
jgi:NTE family protein